MQVFIHEPHPGFWLMCKDVNMLNVQKLRLWLFLWRAGLSNSIISLNTELFVAEGNAKAKNEAKFRLCFDAGL